MDLPQWQINLYIVFGIVAYILAYSVVFGLIARAIKTGVDVEMYFILMFFWPLVLVVFVLLIPIALAKAVAGEL